MNNHGVKSRSRGFKIVDQMVEGASTGTSAEVLSGGDGSRGNLQEGDSGEDRRTLVEEGRTPMGFESEGPQVHRLDPRGAVEGLVVMGRGSGGATGSSSHLRKRGKDL